MRRRIQFSIGVLETILACVLFVTGWMLPRPESVEKSFGRVEHVTRSAESQVRVMREQVSEVRHNDFPRITAHLRAQTRGFSARWKNPPVDFPSVESLDDAVLASAIGLEDWSDAFDEKGRFRQSRRSPRDANSFARATLLTRIALEQCAAHLDDDCRALHTDFGKPIDVASIVQSVGTIGRLMSLLDRFDEAGRGANLSNLRETTAELENSLESAHRHVELASSAEFPLLVPGNTSQPVVQMVPFWPQGKEAARNLLVTLSAVRNMNRQLDEFARLTRIIRTDDRSNDCIELGDRLQVAECALRMRTLAAAFQRMHNGLQRSTADWPGLVQTMRVSAQLLRDSHEQLDGLAGRRSEYERAVQGSQPVTLSAEQLVESYSGRIDSRLHEQEQSLGEMERGLGEASEAIPVVSNTTIDLLNAIRWMFWLVGALLALHGTFVISEARIKPIAAQRS
jgi:hypothetical protein